MRHLAFRRGKLLLQSLTLLPTLTLEQLQKWSLTWHGSMAGAAQGWGASTGSGTDWTLPWVELQLDSQLGVTLDVESSGYKQPPTSTPPLPVHAHFKNVCSTIIIVTLFI